MLGLVLIAACNDSSSSRPPPLPDQGQVVVPPDAVPVGQGFQSDWVITVSSRETDQSLALLSVNQDTGALGVAGGPFTSGVRVGDFETLAVDEANRRVYFGGGAQLIAVADIAADGSFSAVAGSPFTADVTANINAVKLNLAQGVAYVGYSNDKISMLGLDANGAITGPIAPPISVNGNFIETMKIFNNSLLYAICNNTSNIVALQIQPDGTLQNLPVNVPVPVRPDYIEFIGNNMYVSTSGADDGQSFIDAYAINASTGALTRLPDAPYAVPGFGVFELLRADPSGQFIAVGSEVPPGVALLSVDQSDGSLTPVQAFATNLPGRGGPEGILWTPNGRFLYVANHITPGIYAYELSGGQLVPATTPRYSLPGFQIDLSINNMPVTPGP